MLLENNQDVHQSRPQANAVKNIITAAECGTSLQRGTCIAGDGSVAVLVISSGFNFQHCISY